MIEMKEHRVAIWAIPHVAAVASRGYNLYSETWRACCPCGFSPARSFTLREVLDTKYDHEEHA